MCVLDTSCVRGGVPDSDACVGGISGHVLYACRKGPTCVCVDRGLCHCPALCAAVRAYRGVGPGQVLLPPALELLGRLLG